MLSAAEEVGIGTNQLSTVDVAMLGELSGGRRAELVDALVRVGSSPTGTDNALNFNVVACVLIRTIKSRGLIVLCLMY